MTLRLREGWQSVKTETMTWLFPPKATTTSFDFYAYVDVDVNDIQVAAYPHGGYQEQLFDTIEEAHAYLIEKGSESPWEVVP